MFWSGGDESGGTHITGQMWEERKRKRSKTQLWTLPWSFMEVCRGVCVCVCLMGKWVRRREESCGWRFQKQEREVEEGDGRGWITEAESWSVWEALRSSGERTTRSRAPLPPATGEVHTGFNFHQVDALNLDCVSFYAPLSAQMLHGRWQWKCW